MLCQASIFGKHVTKQSKALPLATAPNQGDPSGSFAREPWWASRLASSRNCLSKHFQILLCDGLISLIHQRLVTLLPTM